MDKESELSLNIFHHFPIKFEGLGKDIRIDCWHGAKDSIGYADDSWVLAADTGKGNGIRFPNRQNKHIDCLQYFGE
ncbi:hypothetical protein V6N13_027118 [Hibiscus sabdariffa]